ncbi:GNAT family N-acetyltransferase [Bacteroidaceae bacterium HV4-6-C5C]|jgi:Acetyltransferases, including N-acetylases of ribosomal proteins|nr:GNAT family N-acetyltransferase [Bacteroidaceae bacterium HV4-6-C5C]
MERSYLLGQRVKLRAMEPEDLEIMYEMENDPEQWDITCFNVPYSRYIIKQYMENTQCDMYADKQLRLMIIRLKDQVAIGTIDITGFLPMHLRGEVGISLKKEYRGEGYGSEALALLCEYAFGFLCLKQLSAEVAVGNELSLKLFTSCGFEQCGLLKEWWFVEGHFKDVILLQKLRTSDEKIDLPICLNKDMV